MPIYDTLIKNGLLLTLEQGVPAVPDGYAAVKDGLIACVGPMSELEPETSAHRVVDASGRLIMPGLINTHVHAAMTVFRGLADDLPLMTWLNEHIFPAEEAQVNEELVYWGARLATAEMLLSGTTGFADGYFCEDGAVRAVLESGMRAVLGQGVIDFPAPGVPDPSRNIENARRFLERWSGASPLISLSVFCHSPYTCSPETLVQGKELAREFKSLFQIHAAETATEVMQIRQDRGTTPIRYLDSLNILDENTLAVHCVHLEDEEIHLLADRAVSAAVCPESQMKLASGLAPVNRLLAAGVNVCLGTDGPASNNDLNLFGEMKTLALAGKIVDLDPTALPAEQMLSLAAPAGARALGWTDGPGLLAPGRPADLIILDLDRPHLKPLYNPCSHLVYAASGREVATVMVEGRIVVDERCLTTIDLEETMARVRKIAKGMGAKI